MANMFGKSYFDKSNMLHRVPKLGVVTVELNIDCWMQPIRLHSIMMIYTVCMYPHIPNSSTYYIYVATHSVDLYTSLYLHTIG